MPYLLWGLCTSAHTHSDLVHHAGARDFQYLGVAMVFCVIPALGALFVAARAFDLGLITLWIGSGTLIIARVIALSLRYASKRGPLSTATLEAQSRNNERKQN